MFLLILIISFAILCSEYSRKNKQWKRITIIWTNNGILGSKERMSKNNRNVYKYFRGYSLSLKNFKS